MANPSIGGIEFIPFEGNPPQNPATMLEKITRAEVHGDAWRDLGRHGKAVQIKTEADVSDPATTRAAYMAMQGTSQTVVTPDGETVQEVIVIAVEPGIAQKMIKSVGGLTNGSGLWVLPCTWTLQGGKVT